VAPPALHSWHAITSVLAAAAAVRAAVGVMARHSTRSVCSAASARCCVATCAVVLCAMTLSRAAPVSACVRHAAVTLAARCAALRSVQPALSHVRGSASMKAAVCYLAQLPAVGCLVISAAASCSAVATDALVCAARCVCLYSGAMSAAVKKMQW
jgi:hypothetical protein